MQDLIDKVRARRELGATRIEVKADGSVVAEFGAHVAFAPVQQPVFVPIVQPASPWWNPWGQTVYGPGAEPIDITPTFTCGGN